MILLGITGTMGTGKTTVAGMFASFGVIIINADELARSVAKPGTRIWEKLHVAFEPGIFDKDGFLNRHRLAEIVFVKEPRKLKLLNSIIHPEIKRIIREEISREEKNGTHAVAVDAPLLIEAGVDKIVDKIIVVTADGNIREQRIMKKHKLCTGDIAARISVQIPQAEKIKKADYIIDNNGSIENTFRQVKTIWRKENDEYHKTKTNDGY